MASERFGTAQPKVTADAFSITQSGERGRREKLYALWAGKTCGEKRNEALEWTREKSSCLSFPQLEYSFGGLLSCPSNSDNFFEGLLIFSMGLHVSKEA